MSYFVFGLIDGTQGSGGATARVNATAERMELKLGDGRRQPVLDEMLGTYSPTKSAPFLLTKTREEDTSDSLVSPYVVGVDGSSEAFAAIGRWLVATLRSPDIERVRVWMTEGYDSVFDRLEVPADRFADEVVTRVRAARDVPSLQVTVVK